MNPRREDSVQAQKKYSPGPGAYSPRVDYTRQKSPNYRIGTQSRDGLGRGDGQVGPGSYNLRGDNKGPKWG